MSFIADSSMLSQLGQKIEQLTKSFNAVGYNTAPSAGRTGTNALVLESIDPVMKVITIQEKQFKLTKGLQTVDAKSSTYSFRVNTAVSLGIDPAIFENANPQEDAGQYVVVTEALKVYGVRQTYGIMQRLVADAGGMAINPEDEMDRTSAMSLAQAMERDGYAGGDYYINPLTGDIDPNVALHFYGDRQPVVRNARGLQSQVRAGNQEMFGIPGDFENYGNSFRTVFDLAGAALTQESVDQHVQAVLDNAGEVSEAHATGQQMRSFRATFLAPNGGIQRIMLGERTPIRGPEISGDYDGQGFLVDSMGGPIRFVPAILKNAVLQKPAMLSGSYGAPPATPVVTSVTQALVAGSKLTIGQVYRILVQAVNIAGRSAPSAGNTVTVAATGNALDVLIAAQAGVESFNVFITPAAAGGAIGRELFAGRVVAPRAGATTFRWKAAVIPGLESIVYLPAERSRVKVAKLGNLVNKIQLGRIAMGDGIAYASFMAFVVEQPRSMAVVDNVGAAVRA